MKHTISARVENKPGVLARMSGLFARRGFNIDSLAVSTTEDPGVSRMTITVTGDEFTLEQICNQLVKLVDVIEVVDHTNDAYVDRELCLCKVCCDAQTRHDIIDLCNIFRADVVDVGNETLILQITGDEDKIDAFVRTMEQFGVREMVRTGKILLVRGVQRT
ncbi:acetolactate synthase small subunit [bacterium]|nr:acetolactate synthase small subunit [bacterium]